MKRQFIDTIIEMKLDECESTIKEIHEKVLELGRREPYIRKGTDAYEGLEQEFLDAALVLNMLRTDYLVPM